ncbi:MAG: hypothetical protein RIS09_766 [Actinomycetota bacterium]|jgi:ABC-type transport system involved in multi-copper enzyme maturation permease subunit
MSVLLFEWRRISTLRSTWILSVIAILQAVLILNLPFLLAEVPESATATSLNDVMPLVIIPVFIIFMSTIVAAAFGHDYRHGTIRTSLSLFPNRFELLFGRVVVAFLFTFVIYVVTILAIVATIYAWSSVSGGLQWASFWPAFLRGLLYMTIYNLGVIAVVMMTRIQALGIVAPLMMSLAVENIVLLTLGNRYAWLGEYFPYSQGLNWALGFSNDFAANSGTVTDVFTSMPPSFLISQIVLFGFATFLFQKRDTS